MRYKQIFSIFLILTFVLVSSFLITKLIKSFPEMELSIPQEEDSDVLSSSNEEVLVTRVIDGDTIEISGGEKVRYIGIDAPESPNNKNAECFAFNSYLKNSELVLGKRVRLEKDKSDKDRYGRLLRYVYVDETFVNYELVRQGYAVSKEYRPDIAYTSLFKTALIEAQMNERGIWSYCGTNEDVRLDEFMNNILQLN